MITSKLPKKFAETKTFAARKMMKNMKKTLEDERKGWFTSKIGAWKRKVMIVAFSGSMVIFQGR